MKDEKFEPFDLARAQAGEPIQSRDGFPVKFIAYEPEAINPLVVLYGARLHAYQGSGESEYDMAADIVMAPKKLKKFEGWTGLYPNDFGDMGTRAGALFKSRESAKSFAHKSVIAIAHVTWEEPE